MRRRLTGTTLLFLAMALLIASAGAAMASDAGGGQAPALSVPQANQLGIDSSTFSTFSGIGFTPPGLGMVSSGGATGAGASVEGAGGAGAGGAGAGAGSAGTGALAPIGQVALGPLPSTGITDLHEVASPVLDTPGGDVAASSALPASAPAAPIAAPTAAPIAAPVAAPVPGPIAAPEAAPVVAPASPVPVPNAASPAPTDAPVAAGATIAVPAVQTSVGVLAVLAVLLLFLSMQGRFDQRDPKRALERSDRDFVGFR